VETPRFLRDQIAKGYFAVPMAIPHVKSRNPSSGGSATEIRAAAGVLGELTPVDSAMPQAR
jgi:hypothetical protein